MFIPLVHPCLMHGSRVLLGWSLAKQYQVDSVLPTVAPSIICFTSELVMSHGGTRCDAYKTGVLRTHCKLHLVVLTVWINVCYRNTPIEILTRITCVVIGKVAYRSILSHQWCHINGGWLRLGSWITENQLWGILVLVGAHFRIKLFNQ